VIAPGCHRATRSCHRVSDTGTVSDTTFEPHRRLEQVSDTYGVRHRATAIRVEALA
jgi:hypothetical protein